jgi:hypothetical protein
LVKAYNNVEENVSKENVKKVLNQLNSYLLYASVGSGALTIGDVTWFVKLAIDKSSSELQLCVSKPIYSKNMLKSIFYVLFYARQPLDPLIIKAMQYQVANKMIEVAKLENNQNAKRGEGSVEGDEGKAPPKKTKLSETNKESNGFQSSAIADTRAVFGGAVETGADSKSASEIDSVKFVDSGNCSLEENPPWSGVELGRLLHAMFYKQEYVALVADSGLTGQVIRVSLSGLYPDMPDVVVKSFEVYRDEDWRGAHVREHILNEMSIYAHLMTNSSSHEDYWPAHVPVCFYAGTFDLFCGVILAHVANDARVSKFSEMSSLEKEACLAALRELHACQILHGDVHFGNFVLSNSSKAKAFIIDFGRSKICRGEENQRLFEEEEQLLVGKLKHGDDSAEQAILERNVKNL